MLSRRRLPRSYHYVALSAVILAARMWGHTTNLSCFTERFVGYNDNNFHAHANAHAKNAPKSFDNQMKMMEPFCIPWDKLVAHDRSLQPFDTWFTHHPTWIVSNETDSKFCVEPGSTQTHPYGRGLLTFYANQFHSPCDHVHVRSRWSSGWGADFLNMQAGLLHALDNHIPLIMTDDLGYPENPYWHYSANKNDSSALTCEEGDTTCYYLPYHGCGNSNATYWKEREDESRATLLRGGDIPDGSEIQEELGKTAYLFMTRKMLWFRRAVFDAVQTFKRTNNITVGGGDGENESSDTATYTNNNNNNNKNNARDCTVVHVRRSDVIFHESHTRRYFPVADYVKLIPREKLSNPNHYIFLLTDDSNAIEEANEFFPNLNWKYFDRPRHKGSSGGWENQTPSRNPALEVIILVATFELAQECSAIVHGHSNFAEYIYQQMLLGNRPGVDIERYRVESGESVYNPIYNASESELEKTLNDLRLNHTNGTDILSLIEKQPTDHQEDAITNSPDTDVVSANWTEDDCKEDFGGIIIVNILGLLANDLFEAAFAKRMAEQLGCSWTVFYRTMWNTAFPNSRTDRCFPNALAKNNNRHGEAARRKQHVKAIRRIQDSNNNGTRFKRIRELYQALTYNDHEPDKKWDNNDDQANKITSEWEAFLGDQAIVIEHEAYPLQEDHVDKLVAKLRDPSSPVKVLSLKAFFIHYDWMHDWMDQIADWLTIDPSCCITPAPSDDNVVIHIRDFEEEDDDKNKHLQIGAYRDIINRYSNNSTNTRKVIVVCQPKSIETDVVQDLVKEYNAVVQPGKDNIDAFCILANAKSLFIPSTSSSFSEMAALLAAQKNEKVQVHYPTHTLDYPMVTLNVTSWKYHLTNKDNNGIAEFDVDHHRLKVRQA